MALYCVASMTETIKINVYLADQNPHRDRSLGISQMTQDLLCALDAHSPFQIQTIASASSITSPLYHQQSVRYSWPTDRTLRRLVTDHFHRYLNRESVDYWYYPKGSLPRFGYKQHANLITIHDTIVAYYAEHYPSYRHRLDYAYWLGMLKHSLRQARLVFAVSETSKQQILEFCNIQHINPPTIAVTYESSDFEQYRTQPIRAKQAYYLHLASAAPHKQTEQLIHLWQRICKEQPQAEKLRLVGRLPAELAEVCAQSSFFELKPPLPREELAIEMAKAQALIINSEIEGFGLPAIEACYLGTPVACVEKTSVAEILTAVGAQPEFIAHNAKSLFHRLEQLKQSTPSSLERIREAVYTRYSAAAVAERFTSAVLGLSH